MDTQNSVATDAPEFKLAKVGKGRRERKRAGAGWFGGGGSGSGFSGAFGGAGEAAGGLMGGAGGGVGLAGMSAAKVVLSLLLASGLSAAAWQFGRSFSGNAPAVKTNPKKLFDDKGGRYADTSGVIKQGNTIPNSLGYVNGSLDGLTPEQRAAKKAAEEEAARKAAEDEAAAKKAEEDEAARQAKAQEKAGRSAAGDPAALAGALSGLGHGGSKLGKFGSMSGLGGLSGGSGLAGGIAQSFKSSPLAVKPDGKAGSLSAFSSRAKPGMTAGGRSLAGKSKAKGFAKRQLDNAFTQSKAATTAGKTENASAGAAVPFDGNNGGGGSVISGPGTTTGGGSGLTTADGGTPTNPGGGSGGPITNSGGAACSVGMNPDINGTCVKTDAPPPTGAPNNEWMIKLAEGLLVLIGILSVMCLAFKGKAWFEAIAQAISAFIGILGGMVAALGIMYMASSGDKVMGGILTAIGALVCAVAFWPTATTSAPAATNAGAGGIIQQIPNAIQHATLPVTYLV
ncbi:MAG: hypothetical protein KGL74_11565 [Elusimicrobia bacterium]|nr:hypothetical protein [Elusimicrobiota bacterium]